MSRVRTTTPVTTSTTTVVPITEDHDIEAEDVVSSPSGKLLTLPEFLQMAAMVKRRFIHGNFPTISEKNVPIIASDFRLFSYLYNHI